MRRGRRAGPLDLPLAGAWLAGAMLLNFLAGRFADQAGLRASPSPDLLFSYLPVVDTSLAFGWGFALFLVWLLAAAFWLERERAAYMAWTYALLVYTRCFFIILTPMRLPADAVHVTDGWLHDAFGRFLTFRHDLFFSSHTALPFLGFLLFREGWVRLTFLGLSLMLAATVLLGRLHYSIDVFAAWFITYAVFTFNERWLYPYYARLMRRWFAVK